MITRSLTLGARAAIVAILLGISMTFAPTHRAEAVIEPIYTLPFAGSYVIPDGGCFHCYYDPVYGWHEGTDYNLGAVGVGGHPVIAAARGTAKNCGFSDSAGYYLVLDHGNGYRTYA